MDAGIDFLAEDLLGTLDGQRGDLLAQGFAGAHGLLLGLVAGSRDDLAGLFVRTALGFFDDLLGAALGVGKTAGGLGARRRQFLFDALVGGLQFGLGLVGGRQARGDLCARSSKAFAIGGHTNLIVNSTSNRKTMA